MCYQESAKSCIKGQKKRLMFCHIFIIFLINNVFQHTIYFMSTRLNFFSRENSTSSNNRSRCYVIAEQEEKRKKRSNIVQLFGSKNISTDYIDLFSFDGTGRERKRECLTVESIYLMKSYLKRRFFFLCMHVLS